MQKIAIITCYKKQDYVRATTLTKAIKETKGYTPIIVKNRLRGAGRYLEVPLRLVVVRIMHRPAAYLLTFRGYEMLLPVRMLTIGKPMIFDEFINAEEWLLENKKMKYGSLVHRTFHFFYKMCLQLPRVILADTKSHADFSATLTGIKRDKYAVVPISADEHIFTPDNIKKGTNAFEVFYYSSESQPLHGIEYVCRAAEHLAKTTDIHFTLIGPGNMKHLVELAVRKGANITHIESVPYTSIADYAHQADVCLAGPFGGTLQSEYVITGKAYQFMAAGRPMIIGKNQETNQVFKDKQNCLIADQASVAVLVQTITWTYRNQRQLEKIGKRAHRLYETNFSNKQLRASVAGVLKSAVKG